MTERHFISYPKSGRTWIRYVLHGLDLDSSISFHHDGFEFNDGNMPAHDFDISIRQRLYRGDVRIVYLRRDPRDVMVSLYHQVTGRFDDFFHYSGSISDFIRDPYFGAEVLARFRHMWLDLASTSTVLVVDYEDCHQNLIGVINTILKHYGFTTTMDKLQESCASADLQKMKAIEASGKFPHPWLNLRNRAPKVRRGRIGNYLDELCSGDIAYLNEVFGLME
jgi:hypothetical protein